MHDDPWIIPKRLIDEDRDHLVLTRPIPLECPVRLIHGQMDEDVPWQTSIETARAITGDDVQITLIKDGGHRLSRPQDLSRLNQVVTELL
jgi:pimeloyl-ACP methyl ester carboxylesterase